MLVISVNINDTAAKCRRFSFFINFHVRWNNNNNLKLKVDILIYYYIFGKEKCEIYF